MTDYSAYIQSNHAPAIEFDSRKAGRFEPIYSKKQRDPETKLPDRVEPRESRRQTRREKLTKRLNLNRASDSSGA